MIKVTYSCFKDVQETLRSSQWSYFGHKNFECPGLNDNNLELYEQTHKLPSPCNSCYKALIFWQGTYSEENITNFLKMINSFQFAFYGKLNQIVVVFYFREKGEMLEFLEFLSNAMQKNKVTGKIQWRRSCKQFQDQIPELWKDATTFLPG